MEGSNQGDGQSGLFSGFFTCRPPSTYIPHCWPSHFSIHHPSIHPPTTFNPPVQPSVFGLQISSNSSSRQLCSYCLCLRRLLLRSTTNFPLPTLAQALLQSRFRCRHLLQPAKNQDLQHHSSINTNVPGAKTTGRYPNFDQSQLTRPFKYWGE